MKVIYITEDGKEFDSEYECENYEWLLKHPHLKGVCFYDKDNNSIFDDIMSEDTYNKVEKIIIHTPQELVDFIDYVKYSGFDAYVSINSTGTWIYNEDEGLFIKCEKKLFAYWGSFYGEHVVGVTLAYDDADAKIALSNDYTDFNSWDYYDIKMVDLKEDSVYEIYYGG